MRQTITEKIFSNAVGRQVKAGDFVSAKVDRIMTMDTVVSLVFNYYEKLDAGPLRNPELLVLVFDHLGCGHNLKDAETIKKARACASKYGLSNFYDIGRNGISHQIMVEEGFVQPGKFVVATDSHTTTYGALGAVACGVTVAEAGVILATGENWFMVPGSIKIELVGRLPKGVYGKDIALKMVNILGCDKKAIYKTVEIGGEGVGKLSIDDRITICNMVAETGAKSGIIAGDEKTKAYLHDIAKSEYEIVESDPDAVYEAVYQINLDELEPLIAVPHLAENIRPAYEAADIKVNHVFLGSCTNGRLEDLRIAAGILKNKKIASGVRMVVVPASQKIFLQALKEGIVETLLQAGTVVESSSCASCMGLHTGILPSGETAVSTTNRNFEGRMGSHDSFVYLSSPAVAAATALEGRITDPRKYLE
jgi:3-isopropylmalate/(R)-2-methylmalate dehydratase large subunit